MPIRFLVLLALALASHGQAPDHGPLATLESASVPERYPEIAADDLAPQRNPSAGGKPRRYADPCLCAAPPEKSRREGSVGDLASSTRIRFRFVWTRIAGKPPSSCAPQDRLTPEQANVSIHATLQNQGFIWRRMAAGGLN
jgi:hypothetical protein